MGKIIPLKRVTNTGTTKNIVGPSRTGPTTTPGTCIPNVSQSRRVVSGVNWSPSPSRADRRVEDSMRRDKTMTTKSMVILRLCGAVVVVVFIFSITIFSIYIN